MLHQIPICEVEFQGNELEFSTVTLAAYNLNDLFRGIRSWYPDFDKSIFKLIEQGFDLHIIINGEFLVRDFDDLQILFPYEINNIQITSVLRGEGTVGKILLGVGLLVGLGYLGVSWTTLGLLGASLVFSSVFKHPKTDTNKESEKRSSIFTGTVNVTGSGNCLPLCFGEVYTGSIVVSAHISPDEQLFPANNTTSILKVSDNNVHGIQYQSNPSNPMYYWNPQLSQYVPYPNL